MQTEKNHEMEQSVVTRFLIAGGAIGPLLFMIVLLIEGATRPGYSAWHNYGSSLSLGDQGWMQIANFLVCGLLILGFAIGLRQVFQTGRGSVWGPILLGVFGVSLIVAGHPWQRSPNAPWDHSRRRWPHCFQFVTNCKFCDGATFRR